MALLVLAYILVTLLVQASRFIKRFYVRRFANNINRRMKGIANKSRYTPRGLLQWEKAWYNIADAILWFYAQRLAACSCGAARQPALDAQ